MPSFTLLSHAKLNLALKIVGKRPDGFHELQTVFERIDLADKITFSPSVDNKIHITSSDPRVPCDERNLVYKAAQLLMAENGLTKGARIHIEKRIPVAAGLAGGSSNGATALLGLNRLWRLRLSRTELVSYAKRIGSDVAFFLYDRPFALGTGRGEKIKVLDIKGKFWHVLITPKAPLLTKDVYNMYAARFLKGRSPARTEGLAQLTKPKRDVTMLLRSLEKAEISGVQTALFNDLEGPIGVLRPSLLKLKGRLQKMQPEGVCFSGSGPSVFAVVPTRIEAEAIAKRFRKAYAQVFVIRTA